MKMVDGVARRCRIDLMTPAELAIREAMLAVERAGCDTRLTDAVVLLGGAQNRVADFVEDVPSPDDEKLAALKRWDEQVLIVKQELARVDDKARLFHDALDAIAADADDCPSIGGPCPRCKRISRIAKDALSKATR